MYRDEIDFGKKRHVACLINARCSRRFTYVCISAFSCMIQDSLRMAGKCCWLLQCMFNYFLLRCAVSVASCTSASINKRINVQVHFDHVIEYNGVA